MSDDSKKTAQEVQDQDLEQAQGGFEINFAPTNDLTAININNDHRMTNSWMPAEDAVNINNDYQTTNDIAVNINNEY